MAYLPKLLLAVKQLDLFQLVLHLEPPSALQRAEGQQNKSTVLAEGYLDSRVPNFRALPFH